MLGLHSGLGLVLESVQMVSGFGMRPSVLATFLILMIKYLTEAAYIRRCLFSLVFGGCSPVL